MPLTNVVAGLQTQWHLCMWCTGYQLDVWLHAWLQHGRPKPSKLALCPPFLLREFLLVLTWLWYALIIGIEYVKPHAKTNFYQQRQNRKELSRQHRSWLNWHFPSLTFCRVHALLMYAGNPFHSPFFVNCMLHFGSNTHHPVQADFHSTKWLAYSKQLLGFYSFTYNEAKRTNCFYFQVNQLKLRVI